MSKRLNNEIARHWLVKLTDRRPWRGTARDLARQYCGGDTGRARRIIKRAQKLAADEGMYLDFHPKINSWRIAPAGDNTIAREMLAYKLSLARSEVNGARRSVQAYVDGRFGAPSDAKVARKDLRSASDAVTAAGLAMGIDLYEALSID